MNGNGILNHSTSDTMNSNNGQGKPSSNGNAASSIDESERKLFVGGLTWDTTEDDLRNYFSKFGTIQALNIKYDSATKTSRGYGFITFTTPSVIDTILASAPHKIRDKVVDAKKSNPKPIFKKVFCGGIDGTLPEEEIRKYFSKYGKIEGLELPFDKAKGKRREFCFIIYETEESADAAVQLPKQTIGGRECDVKKAQPQNVAQQQKRQAGNQGGNRPSKLGATGGQGSRTGKNGSRDGSSGPGSSDWSQGWQEGYDHSSYGYPGYPGYPPPPPPHSSVGYPHYDAYHSYPNSYYPGYPGSGDPYWNGYAGYPDGSEYGSSGYGGSGSASSASSSLAPGSSGPPIPPSHHSGHPPPPHHGSNNRSHHMPPPPHLSGSSGPHPPSRGPSGPSSAPAAGKMSRSRPGNNSSYHPYPRN